MRTYRLKLQNKKTKKVIIKDSIKIDKTYLDKCGYKVISYTVSKIIRG